MSVSSGAQPSVQGPVAVGDLLSEASKRFEQEFLQRPDAFSVAPASIPLLGTSAVHENISVSIAVDRYTVVVGRSSQDSSEVRVISTSCAKACVFTLPSIEEGEGDETATDVRGWDWSNIIRSLVQELRQLSGIDISGFTAVVHSTIPSHQSMNSSAALEVAMAALLQRLFPQSFCTVSQMDMILACRRADQKCSDVGSNAFTSSALEQLTCTFSRQMHAIHADAGDMRIFDFIAFPSQPTIRLLLIVPLVSQESPHLPLDRWQDSPTEDELAISAAQLMGRPSLRDIAIEDVDRASLDDRQRKAVMGVVLEANRVNQLVSMQRSCTAEDLGALLNSDRLANDECHRLLSAIRFLPGIFGCRRVNGSYQSPSSFAAIAIADVGVCGPYLVKFSQEYNCTINVLTPADGAYSSYLKFMAPQQ